MDDLRELAYAGLGIERSAEQDGWLPQTPDSRGGRTHPAVRAALRWVRDFDWTARAAFFDPDYLFKRDMRRIARSCVLRPTVDQGNYLLVLWSAHVPATEPF